MVGSEWGQVEVGAATVGVGQQAEVSATMALLPPLPSTASLSLAILMPYAVHHYQIQIQKKMQRLVLVVLAHLDHSVKQCCLYFGDSVEVVVGALVSPTLASGTVLGLHLSL